MKHFTGSILLVAFLLSSFGIRVYAGPGNIAREAKVTAFSPLDQGFKASNVNDGVIAVEGKGEWAC
ncbi:MAG TPA: hypothetical protein VFX43_02835 [Chitinophagaceae bacterium]|nr:hypothetical protein [Chitinophagaceae bacterium]